MTQLLDHADILLEASCYVSYLWMADRSCKKYLGTPQKAGWSFIPVTFSGWSLIAIADRQYPALHIFLLALSRLFFMGAVVVLFPADREKKLLAASLLMLVITLVENFCGSFLTCLALSFQHTIKKIPEPFLSTWEAGLIAGIRFFLAILALSWLTEHLTSVFYGKPRKWYVVSAVPLLAVIAVVDVANWGASNGIMVRSGGTMGLYHDQMFSHAEICVLTGLSMFAAGSYVFGMDRIYLEQEKSSRYHAQIAVYKMLEEQYRQSERLRHDMKNHIIALSGLFQSKEWERMGDYLKNMEGNGLEAGGDSTGDKAVDALLYQKRKRAEEEKIRWECDVQIPKACQIDAFDLCILFGNIVDNALEACERLGRGGHRFVSIQAKAVKKCFLLEVKNSMDRTEPYKQEKTRAADKERAKGHGIGLLNVRDVVRRYNGVMDIEAENGIFQLSILMPLEDAAHDIRPTV